MSEDTFQTTRHLVPVTKEAVLCDVPWDWLDWTDIHLDPGFPDEMDRYREGYFKVRTAHAPAEHDPSCVVRVRCAVGPADYWEQEPDPDEGYEPPPSSFRGEPVHEVTPAKDAHGMPWWIIVTRTPDHTRKVLENRLEQRADHSDEEGEGE